MIFENYPDNSRVWIYTSNKELTPQEEELINKRLTAFIPSWASHGNDLFGGGIVLNHRFLVLCVDNSKVYASGCSIDTSVRFIKELGQELNIDFFDRMNLIVHKNDETKSVRLHEMDDYLEWNIYNPMITTLGELRNSWLIPVKSSAFAK